MAIVTFDRNELVEYVPTSERDSDDPTIIVMRHVPFSEVERYSRMVSDVMKGGAKDIERVAAQAKAVQRKQFCENVVEVRNYYVMRDGAKVAITTGDELYDIADNTLITEILRAMENAAKLNEGQLKNFVRASGTVSELEPAKSPSLATPVATRKLKPATAETAKV